MKVEVAVLGVPVPFAVIVLMVFVDVKQHKFEVALLGSPSLIVRLVSVDVKRRLKKNTPELRNCVNVEVAVLGYRSLIVRMVSVDVNQH